MADAFLSTKLYIPPIKHPFVVRTRLYSILEKSEHHKLTLISAPAGFGKSTLAANWLAETGRTAAWLSLDERDNNPARFWSYIINAIQRLQPDIGQSASEIVNSPQLRNIEPVVVRLLNDLAGSQTDIFLILDDYHAIDSQEIHKSLSYFLEHQPPSVQVLLLTRVDPPLSLGRLRAAGELYEIRASDLQFSLDEATDFFQRVMKLSLATEQIYTLEKRTEGWVVGLKLAALSLQRQSDQDRFIQSFSGSHRYILEYLTEEVLNLLPEAQRAFLLQTSILDSFCADLCKAVTGNPESAQVLDDLNRENMFIISLDAAGEWFRYHHLFGNLLDALLEQNLPEDVSELHLKAARWYEKSGLLAEAVEHAFRSDDIQQTKHLILKHWNEMLHRGGVTTVLQWVKRLPEEMARDNVYLALANCWALHLSGQTPAIAPYLDFAGGTFDQMVSRQELSGKQKGFVESQIYMMRSVLARSLGKTTDSVAYAERGVEVVPPDIGFAAGPAWNLLGAARVSNGDLDGGIKAYQRGMQIGYTAKNMLSAFSAAFWSTYYLNKQGRLNEAFDLCQRMIEQASRDRLMDFPATGLLFVAQAMIELERDHLEEAHQLVSRGGSFSEALRYGRFIRARLYLAQGEIETAVSTMQDIESVILASRDANSIGEMNFEWAKLDIRTENIEAAKERFRKLDQIVEQQIESPLLRFSRDWLAAYLYAIESRNDKALEALEDAVQRARASHTNGDLLRMLILQAIVLDKAGQPALSRVALNDALDLGESQDYVSTWLDAGTWVLPFLYKAQQESSFSSRQLSYMNMVISVGCRVYGDQAAQSESANPLTERELQIMRLICAGCSNPQIAEELFVTINTVKKHTSNIYSKLGVTSRTQAIARLHELDLV